MTVVPAIDVFALFPLKTNSLPDLDLSCAADVKVIARQLLVTQLRTRKQVRGDRSRQIVGVVLEPKRDGIGIACGGQFSMQIGTVDRHMILP